MVRKEMMFLGTVLCAIVMVVALPACETKDEQAAEMDGTLDELSDEGDKKKEMMRKKKSRAKGAKDEFGESGADAIGDAKGKKSKMMDRKKRPKKKKMKRPDSAE